MFTVLLLAALPLPAHRPGWSLSPTAGPEQAVGRLTCGRCNGSATVLGPRRPDGRWHVVTAAHCLTGVPHAPVPGGLVAWLHLKDGRSVSLRVVGVDPRCDVAVLATRLPWKDLPHAVQAAEPPKEGDRLWHCGYSPYAKGKTRPLVVAGGRFVDATPFSGEVGHGDSGGGVFNARGEFVGVMTNGTPDAPPVPGMAPGVRAPPYRRGLFRPFGLLRRLFGRRHRALPAPTMQPVPLPVSPPQSSSWSLSKGGVR